MENDRVLWVRARRTGKGKVDGGGGGAGSANGTFSRSSVCLALSVMVDTSRASNLVWASACSAACTGSIRAGGRGDTARQTSNESDRHWLNASVLGGGMVVA